MPRRNARSSPHAKTTHNPYAKTESVNHKASTSLNFLGLATLAAFPLGWSLQLGALVSHGTSDNLPHADRLSSRTVRRFIVA
jgi:hypothetical protein